MKSFLHAIFLSCLLVLGGTTAFAETVNINKADAATLQQHLTGIGKVKANAIVNYRKKNGNFSSLDDLLNVKGIGKGLISKNRKNLSLRSGISSVKSASKSATKKSATSQTAASKKPERNAAKSKLTKSKNEKDSNVKRAASKTKNKDNKKKIAKSNTSNKKDKKKSAQSSANKKTQVSRN